jgi:FkbM family methyltransferase
MNRKMLGMLAGVLVFLFVGAPIAINSLRPDGGYRKTLALLIDPQIAEAERKPIETVANFNAKRKVDFVVDFYGHRYRGNTENLIDSYIYSFGAFEKGELYFIRDVLVALKADSVFIDVGANTGQHSVFASTYAKQVHAFEPFPPVLSRLEALVDENNISNIVVHPVGLGDAEAELPFFSPPTTNLGTGSFVSGFKEDNTDEHLKLRIVSGDGYFPHAKISRVDLMKIDIEGYEKAALAGLQRTLQQHRPIVVMEISIDPPLPGLFKSLQELKTMFPENYEFFALEELDYFSGAYRLQAFKPDFTKRAQFNIVARPNEKSGIVPMFFKGDSSNP